MSENAYCDLFHQICALSTYINNLFFQVSACSKVDLILGVLGWSTGCSWPSLMEDRGVLEC